MIAKILSIKTLSKKNKIIFWLNLFFCLCLIFSYVSIFISPQTITILAFFGLFYPPILVINILFIIYWLIHRKKMFMWSFTTIIIGLGYLFTFITIDSSNSVSNNNDYVKIMSYNVRLFDLYNWSGNVETKNKIYQLLQKESPDIVCFQEFYSDSNDTAFNTIPAICKLLKLPFYKTGFTSENNNRSFGLCTFSKYPIVNSGELTFNNDFGNNCIFIDIVVDTDTIRVYNTHIGSIGFQYADYNFVGGKGFPKWPKDSSGEQKILNRLYHGFIKRTTQTKALISHISKSPYPILFCCDLNDIPISYNYHRLTKVVTDAFTESGSGIGSTYIGNFPFLRIDYIMHSPSLMVSDFDVLNCELSDHRPLKANLQIP